MAAAAEAAAKVVDPAPDIIDPGTGLPHSCHADKWGNHGGATFDPALTVDEALGGSPVRLVCAVFLATLAKHGGRLERRQDLPEAAFISLERLKRMAEGPANALRVICISQCARPHSHASLPPPPLSRLRRSHPPTSCVCVRTQPMAAA